MTLGMLSPGQVAAEGGRLDFYNHNIDTSPDYYARIATTRTREGRIAMLATLPAHPDSVPVNLWNEIEGVPVQERSLPVEPFALVRIVALTRIVMPASVVRLSAGRTGMSDELQVLRFRGKLDLRGPPAPDHRQPGRVEGSRSAGATGNACRPDASAAQGSGGIGSARPAPGEDFHRPGDLPFI